MKNWKAASVSKTWLLIQYLQFPSTFTPFFITVSRYWLFQFVPLWVINLCAYSAIIGSSCRCFIWWFLLLVINSFICRWLVLQSVGYWFVILNWRLMVMLIQTFLNTSTRLISVLQSLVHHICALFGGFFCWWLIHSFADDWCYNL